MSVLYACLYLCSCPANRFICTIFLDSTYMLIYDICFSLSYLWGSCCNLLRRHLHEESLQSIISLQSRIDNFLNQDGGNYDSFQTYSWRESSWLCRDPSFPSLFLSYSVSHLPLSLAWSILISSRLGVWQIRAWRPYTIYHLHGPQCGFCFFLILFKHWGKKKSRLDISWHK